MLLSEQVRQIRDEEVLGTFGPEEYTTTHDWTIRYTKEVTLTSTKIVYVTLKIESSNTNTGGAGRVTLNGVPIMSTGAVEAEAVTRQIYLALPPATYTIRIQTSLYAYGAGETFKLDAVKVATLNFSDKQRYNWDSGLVSAGAAGTTTVVNQSFTTPATRKLAVGSIKKHVCIITVHAGNAYYRHDKMKNPGEADDSQYFNWKIRFGTDSPPSQVSWTERRDDRGSQDSSPDYAIGAYGRLIRVVDPGVQYNLRIDVYNGYNSAYNVRAVLEVICCPWIMANEDYEPVSLDFPQGSTLYVTVEPLHDNTTTKYVRVGKQRFESFGDATDYYGSLSGIGILEFDYTFEIVEVVNSILHVKGLGGCVSIIGVDIR